MSAVTIGGCLFQGAESAPGSLGGGRRDTRRLLVVPALGQTIKEQNIDTCVKEIQQGKSIAGLQCQRK